jgi:RimJ/RimL family protein N-acetyltransferase
MRPTILGSILVGADALIGEMVKSRIPHMRGQSWGDCATLGVVRRGRLLGGVVYYGYRGFDIQIGVAFDAKGWALPGTLRALCAYPFNELGCERVTAVTSKRNKTARKMLLKAGFRFEGVIRRGLDGVHDGFIYGLLKHECRWLNDGDCGTVALTQAAAFASIDRSDVDQKRCDES